MKKYIIILVYLISINISTYSQGVAINETGNPPNNSAILDVESTSKGILFPRMTSTQMNAIVSPVAGLQIFNTSNECMYYYNGTSWIDLQTCDCGTVTDYDGNTYQAIKINNQCWMAENLKVTHYSNGDAIHLITSGTIWGALADNNTDDAFCYYDNNSSSEYGALYTWAAAMGDNGVSSNTNPSQVQGVCPNGWHLPSDAEWTELTDYLSGEGVAGGKMKETGTSHWNFPNTGATNESEFTGLPAGFRTDDFGDFVNANSYCFFWSSTQENATDAWYRQLAYSNDNTNRWYDKKSYGFSVRCIRD